MTLASECVEVVGRVELYEARADGHDWPPYRRLGRIRHEDGGADPYRTGHSAAGLVWLTDFGTARERSAADDTWTEAQALGYVAMREELASAGMPGPVETGVIVPDNEGAPLERGMHVPPGHLDAQPRVYAVDQHVMGVELPALLRGPPLSAPAVRGLLVVIGVALDRIGRWGSEAKRAILPAHLEVNVFVTHDGAAVVEPVFRYVPSADYAFHSGRAGLLADALEVELASDEGSLARPISELAARADVRWARSLEGSCRALHDQTSSWIDLRAPLSPSTFGSTSPRARSSGPPKRGCSMHRLRAPMWRGAARACSASKSASTIREHFVFANARKSGEVLARLGLRGSIVGAADTGAELLAELRPLR